MEVRMLQVVFTKKVARDKQTSVITHKARVIIYVVEKKRRLLSLLIHDKD